jgi:hypothetical protein
MNSVKSIKKLFEGNSEKTDPEEGFKETLLETLPCFEDKTDLDETNEKINELYKDLETLRTKDAEKIQQELDKLTNSGRHPGSDPVFSIFRSPNVTKPFNVFDDTFDTINFNSKDLKICSVEEETIENVRNYTIKNGYGELTLSVFKLNGKRLYSINETILSEKIINEIDYIENFVSAPTPLKELRDNKILNLLNNYVEIHSGNFVIKVPVIHISLFEKALHIIQNN